MQCGLCSIDTEQKITMIASGKFSNTQAGFTKLAKWIRTYYRQREAPLVVTLEATGVYYEAYALYLKRAGFRVAVVLPNKSKKYMQSLGLRSKTDKIDAQGLAQMGAQQCLSVWQPMSEFHFTLRTLTCHLQSLQQTRTSISNQRYALEVSIYQLPVVV